MGGGFSVIEAMSLGVPVLSHASGDGGHKLGPYAATDDDLYWYTLDQWLEDPAARQQMAVAQHERYQANYNLLNGGPSLTKALTEAQRRGVIRLEGLH
jgi:glycosyltransferase involved in cell wall biosynthesis